MSSWFAWFTSFSTSFTRLCSLPFDIKTRFIRYACRRFIFNFVNLGHLNEDELDAQIQSDVVHFHDIELNHSALNNLLPSLPFILEQASVKAATLHLASENKAFPAPSLSVHSAKFTFHILPSNELSSTLGTTLSDLVESYASAFVHDAMSPPERAYSSRSDPGSGVDIEGHLVAAFTKLVGLALCDIRFDAIDTSISVVFPRQCSFTASIATISIRTKEHQDGRDHRVTLSGITVHFDDLTHSKIGRAADDGRLLSFGRDPVTIVLSEDSSNTMRISTSVGSIGCRVHSWHIAHLIQMLDRCLNHRSRDRSTLSPPSVPIEVEVLLDIRGVVILFCPSTTFNTTNFDRFFMESSALPRLLDGYVHISLDSLLMKHTAVGRESVYELFVRECSAFGFRAVDEYDGEVQTTFPIVVTDRSLPSSYSPVYTHRRPPIDPRKSFVLPEFEVNDWTNEDLCSYDPDPSPWWTKLQGSLPDTLPAFELTLSPPSIQIDLVPLHIYIDASQALNDEVLNYLDEILTALHKTTSFARDEDKFDVLATSPLIRFEIRCSLSGLPTRSGALVIDIHDTCFVYNNLARSSSEETEGLIFSFGASCVLVACSPASRNTAFTVLSIGPLTDHHHLLPPESSNELCRVHRGNTWFGIARRTIGSPRLTLLLVLPSAVSRLSGGTLDSLQYWCLDASHILDVHSQAEEIYTPTQSPSLLPNANPASVHRLLADLGRCFFIREGETVDFETVIKFSVDEAMIRFLVPITGSDGVRFDVHSLDIVASTLDTNIAFKDEGTIFEIEMVQLTAQDRISSTVSHEFFSIKPLDGSPKATLKARFPH
ncbi:hypothetical protein E1B28_008870 [Marasmius oreades]|uniref:Uncharacterized protein n=1 Tax=Marasmius oreades TaxID=181124 RepID=A0A9P7RZB9_9AGAR|nr:uncharacterized protein E1B28_008870 [Marasmius oreades]KAG7092519.1 hypothetical protein E1B28_008870 [Marasmius oreades]